jgi:hypothetical protein
VSVRDWFRCVVGLQVRTFDFQDAEIDHAALRIGELQGELRGVGAVRPNTTLACDWRLRTRSPFSVARGSTAPQRAGCYVEASGSSAAGGVGGGALPVGLLAALWQALTVREKPRREPPVSHWRLPAAAQGGGSGHFDCFDAAGRPLGCHAYAKQTLAKLRFTTVRRRTERPPAFGSMRPLFWLGSPPVRRVFRARQYINGRARDGRWLLLHATAACCCCCRAVRRTLWGTGVGVVPGPGRTRWRPR